MKIRITTDTITFDLGRPKTFDVLMVQEAVRLGHRTTGWSVDYSINGKDWIPIEGATGRESIGYKWLVKFPAVSAAKVRLRITAGRACPAIHTFGIYRQQFM